ncbi:MAG: 50S ribosomal protein L4 [Elusimicrobiota bacterium]
METKLFNMKGEEVGKVELPEKAFGVKPNPALLHEVTTAYLANQRRGTAHTKTRADVSGGGKKPWKQKGTGRARAGSSRSPIWRSGGVTFGPRCRSFRVDLPRAKCRKALAQALSARAADGSLRVVDELAFDGAKTRQVAELLTVLKADKRSLFVVDQSDPTLKRAARNIPGLVIIPASHLNAYQVLACRNIILTRGAIDKLAPKWN